MGSFVKKEVYRTNAGWVRRVGSKIHGPFKTEVEALKCLDNVGISKKPEIKAKEEAKIVKPEKKKDTIPT